MDDRRNVLLWSFVLTVLIFSVGILLNHFFDFFRIATIVDVMREHEIDRDSYAVESVFAEQFQGENCEVMTSRIGPFKEEIRKVGEDLGSYSRFSFFRKKDYDYLKRKYFLMELRFLALINKVNRECGDSFLPILFFYKIDDSDSERQGFILQDLSKAYDKKLVVLSLDVDYEDEPLLDVLRNAYGVSSGPTLIIGGDKYEGLRYSGELNASIRKYLLKADPNAQEIDFMLVPRAAGVDLDRLLRIYKSIALNSSKSAWARGDALLVLGRLTGNESMICDSLDFYDSIESGNPEELALKYETMASLGCGRNSAAFLRAAAEQWRKVPNKFRAELLERLSRGDRLNLHFDDSVLNAKDKVISGYRTALKPSLPSLSEGALIGNTTFIVHSGDVLSSQVDRVFRDWLGGQLASYWGPEILVSFSERLSYSPVDLREDVGWHEGGRVRDLLRINISHAPAVGTLAARMNGRWFAVDDKGVFRFEVPIDKVSYPTARFLRRDLAVLMDTHGVNMLVEQSLRNNVSLVVSDCDHPGKVYAAKYLSDRGVDVACFPDKYVFLALGHNLSLVGSPPLIVRNDSAVIGGRGVYLQAGDSVVVTNATDEKYALWYYQTPASYFDALMHSLPLNATFVELNDFDQMGRVVREARKRGVDFIATRVFSRSDYDVLKGWLSENASRKAILFHSASYPYGQLLFREFVNQTSFDDPNPVFYGKD